MDRISEVTRKFPFVNSNDIGQTMEGLVSQAIIQRRQHERRWYDNEYFDDGYHFRTLNRKTGQVIDHVNRGYGYVERAIPRASRQIRGIANLMFTAEPYPVVYPSRITIESYRTQDGQIDMKAYKQAQDANKEDARKKGTWLTTQWEDGELWLQVIDLILTAMKTSISYLQVYSDTDKQEIKTQVLDGFDVICYGDRREIKDLPFMTKTSPMNFREAQTNPLFDPSKAAKLTPDNKYATSEIKDAYMRSRYGTKLGEGNEATIIIKESFIEEFLTERNFQDALKLDAGGALEGKSKGDQVMRHVFSAGGVTLGDEYINYDCYPFADFRMEPGPIYQVPFMERFIPQNKSVDIIATRLEKWVNAMIVGVYQKRKGENFQISNFPGGQMVEYETTPLSQMNQSSPGNAPFEVLNLMDKYLDEQGATTAIGSGLPSGVKSGIAIESLKATEYANLKIANLMLKKTIKCIAEQMLERADKDILEPQEVESLKDGNPNYFDVIGQRGYDLSQKVNKPLPQGITVLNKDTKVKIEIEPGLGLTMEGRRNAMQSIIDYTLKLSEQGYIPQEAMTMLIKKFIETFGYGPTQEFMEAIEEGPTMGELTEQQLLKVKIALLESLKEAGMVGPEFEKLLVNSSKVGAGEALVDTGVAGAANQPKQEENKPPSKSISFKDLPPEGKAQLAEQAGITLNSDQIAQDEQQQKDGEMAIKQKELAIKEKSAANKANAKPVGSTS